MSGSLVIFQQPRQSVRACRSDLRASAGAVLRRLRRIVGATALVMPLLTAGAPAQEEAPPAPENIPFESGTFTITQNADYEKVLTFDGVEVARNYVLFFDKAVQLGETKVALFSVGDGGNQCGAATVIAWKPADGAIKSDIVGADCGAPPAAVTDSQIFFVPSLLPGETLPVQVWAPDTGIRTAGDLAFTPERGTDWNALDVTRLEYMIDAFDNEAVYKAGVALLGTQLTEVITGLLTGGNAEPQADGTVTGYGCVPHACGVSDTFMAIDPKARKLYFAQKADAAEPNAWPKLAEWPAGLKAAMETAILGQQ